MAIKVKNWIMPSLVGVCSFLLGSALEYSRNTHRKVHSSKSFPFDDGEILLTYFTEWAGLPFLDTNSSSLTISGTSFGHAVTIYEAQRIFQEDYPQVNDMKIDGHTISWTDGRASFVLEISGHEAKNQQNSAAQTTASPSFGL
jgi:hypothetical protein